MSDCSRRSLLDFKSRKEEGLELLGRIPFDVVVTDLKLPGVGGAELLRRLRGSHPGLPVVVITSGDRRHGEADFAEMGAAGYLEKPFMIEEVERAVEKALRK